MTHVLDKRLASLLDCTGLLNSKDLYIKQKNGTLTSDEISVNNKNSVGDNYNYSRNETFKNCIIKIGDTAKQQKDWCITRYYGTLDGGMKYILFEYGYKITPLESGEEYFIKW